MAILSVPLSLELEKAVKTLLDKGYASDITNVVKKAILQVAEEEAINTVLESEKCLKEGNILQGNLRDLIKQNLHT